MTSPYHARAYQLRFDILTKPKGWKFSPDVLKHLWMEPEALTEGTVNLCTEGDRTFMALPIEIVHGDNIMKLIK